MNIKKKKNSFFRPSLFQLEDRLTPSAYVEPNLITSNPATHVLDITLTAHASTQNLEVFTSPLVFTDASKGTSNSPANPPLGTTTKAVDGFLTYSWKINEGVNSVYNLTTSKYDPSGVLMGDSYPGPTLKVNRGDTLRITLLNGLEDLGGLKIIAVPSDTSSSLLKGQVRNPNENIQFLSKTDPLLLPNLITEMPLNNHVHGLHVSPTGSSDNVLLTIPASQGFVYEYKIPQNQPDGLYWMHPHNHEYSNPEVYRGLSNMLIIGESDSSINWGANIPERTMSLQYQLLAVTTDPNTPNSPQYIQKSNGNYSLQDYTGQGDPGQQLTINGLLNPTITVQPGQTEVWTIANMTPQANMNFTLGNNVTYAYDGNNIVPVGNQQIIVVAQDGVAYSTPKIIPAGQFLNLPAGGRVSILVTAPPTGSLQLNFNNYPNASGGQRIGGSNSTTTTGGNPPKLGNPPKSNLDKNWFNITMNSSAPGTGTSLATPTTLTTAGYNPFVDLSTVPAAEIAENRTVTFSIDPTTGGTAAKFEINGEVFPNPEIFQPRLNTVEEWTLLNTSEVAHPFHYHVNDTQVMSVYVPTGSKNSGLYNVISPQSWYQDVVNIPAAYIDSSGIVTPGKVVIRIKNIDYTGAFVYHCHILPHEDRGMMGLNTVQPETPIYVTGAGAGGGPAVSVYNSLNNNVLNTFFAFEQGFTGGVKTAVADVNNDGISDLIVGAGPGGGPRVIVYNGATNFTTQLFDFFAFSSAFSGGVSVAGGDFNADGFADIVVGAGPGGGPQVNIFDGRTGNVLTQFFAYDQSFRGGVTVAVGDVDGSSFNSVITGAGPGGGPNVRTFRNSSFFDIDAARILPGNQSISMNQTGSFFAYETSYTGGVQVAVGLNSGTPFGGFYRILTGTLTAGPEVTIWQAMESEDMTTMDTPDVMFEKVADFFAFDSNLTTGVRVGSVAVSNGSDFLAATGSGTSTVVKRFSLLPGATQPTLEEEFSPFTEGFDGGANLGGTY